MVLVEEATDTATHRDDTTPVRISAIVCTHNRAAYLRKALASLVDQTLDQAAYEIIVVDNASKDTTRAVVDEFAHAPNLRYLYETELGLSRARNTGWRAARGTYVAYLDDDGIASRQWLEKILDVFDQITPQPGVVGGHIEAIWESPRPDWLPDHLLGSLAVSASPDLPLNISKEQILPGCNVAYPRQLLADVQGFAEDLGRQGTSLLASEEEHLRLQIVERGYNAVYHPDVAIQHHVSGSKLQKAYFRRLRYWMGISEARIQITNERADALRRVWLGLDRIGWALPRALLMLAAQAPDVRFRRQCQMYEVIGYVSGMWRLGAASVNQ